MARLVPHVGQALAVLDQQARERVPQVEAPFSLCGFDRHCAELHCAARGIDQLPPAFIRKPSTSDLRCCGTADAAVAAAEST